MFVKADQKILTDKFIVAIAQQAEHFFMLNFALQVFERLQVLPAPLWQTTEVGGTSSFMIDALTFQLQKMHALLFRSIK